MAVNLTIAGQVYPYPTLGDEGWGGTGSDWAVAVSTQLLQRTGGNFILTNDVNFGPSFGILLAYLKSRSANISTAEFIRLAHGDAIAWRNLANDDNLLLTIDPSSDQLMFNGSILLTTLGALTASRALVTDSGGSIATATTTAAEIAFVNGVTSSIQTQLNAKEPTITILGPAKGGTGIANNAAATTTRSGNFALTQTLTNTTSVTYPTSGTLATLAGTETLSSKTLTTPLLNGYTVPVPAAATSGFTIAVTDVIRKVDASSGAITVVLPALAAGLQFTIQKTDSSLAFPVTINTAAAVLVTTLNTQNESVTVVCNGTTWSVIGRYIDGSLNSYTPTITNFGTATLINFAWQRKGQYMLLKGNFSCGTSLAGSAQVSMPANTTAVAGAPMRATGNTVVGSFNNNIATGGSSDFKTGTVLMPAGGGNLLFGFNQTTFASSPFTALTGTQVCLNSAPFDLTAQIPIAGWVG